MKIDKFIVEGKEVITISADDGKNIVRTNGGVLICKSCTLRDKDKISDFIEVADGNDYRVNRANAYPDVAEQLDMLWHTLDEGQSLDKESDFYKAIKAVKDSIPKSE